MKKQLPETAHPHHLKKQAKNLLKACHASEPQAIRRMAQLHPRYETGVPSPAEVKLQEAQHVIAREYGVSSWPQLMADLNTSPPPTNEALSDLLLYTNGQSAITLLESAGVKGQKFEWSDVLYDGPVPVTSTHEEFTTRRARYLSSLGFAGYENIRSRFAQQEKPLAEPESFSELQLWFEHDLFDQLGLVQLICRLAEHPLWLEKTTLFQFDTYLGHLTPEQLSTSTPEPVRLHRAHLQEAARMWDAFRASSPSQLEVLRDEPFSALPHLSACLHRLCEEFPAQANGLTRTEQQILQGLAQGHETPGMLFHYNQQQEEAQFLGDASFFLRLERLTQGVHPLVTLEQDTPFLHPSLHGYTEAFRNQQFQLTPHGKKVMTRHAHWLQDLPTPYWVGGCAIDSRQAFCWDAQTSRFRKWPPGS